MKKRVLALLLGITLVFTGIVNDATVAFADSYAESTEIACEETGETEKAEAETESESTEQTELIADEQADEPLVQEATEQEAVVEENAEAVSEEAVSAEDVAEEAQESEEVADYIMSLSDSASGEVIGEGYYISADGVMFTITGTSVSVSFLDSAADGETPAGPFYGKTDYELTIPSTFTVLVDGVEETVNPTNISRVYPTSTNSSVSSVIIAEGYKAINMGGLQAANVGAISFPSTIESVNETDCFGKNKDILLVEESIPAWYKNLSDTEVSYAGKVAIKVPDIENVTFKNDTLEIMPFAGWGNTNTKSVVIPDSLVSIGAFAFANNTSLTTFTISKESCLQRFGYGVFGYVDSNKGTYTASELSGAPITSIYLPGAVLSSENATRLTGEFNGCTTLEKVTVGEGAKEIVWQMFKDCTSLTSFKLPNSVTSIYGEAFKGCKSLKKFTIGTQSKLRDIGYGAFGYYAYYNAEDEYGAPIESIYIPGAVFNHVYNNIPGIFNGNTSLKSVKIGEGATEIPYETFTGCCSLTSFILPDSVTSIGVVSFAGCTSLKNFVISENSNLTSIGYLAFGFNVNETDYSLDRQTNVNSYDFYSPSMPVDTERIGVAPIENIYLPADVFYKGNSLCMIFAGNSALKTVTIGEAKTYSDLDVGYLTFAHCTNLESVEGLGNVKNISFSSYYGAFLGCSSLKNVDLTGVEKIGYAAFARSGLTEVTIPSSVTYMASFAFANCKSLTEMTIDCSASNSALMDVVGLCSGIYSITSYNGSEDYRYTSLEEYLVGRENATPLQTVIFGENSKSLLESRGYYAAMVPTLKKVVLPEGLERIGSYMFMYDFLLEDVTIPTSVKYINDYAFEGTPHINVDFSKLTNLISIGDRAFFLNDVYGGNSNMCNYSQYENERISYGGIEEIVLPDSVKTVSGYAFYGQVNCKKIVIPESVTTIGTGAFQFNNSLQELYVFANLEGAGEYGSVDELTYNDFNTAFWNNHSDSLQKIVLGANVTDDNKIPDGFFWGSTARKIDVQFNYESVGKAAFGNCKNIKTLSLNPDVTKIDVAAFIGDENLTTIENTGNVTNVGNEAFKNCDKLNNINLNSVKVIGKEAFFGVNGMSSIILPASLEEIHLAAFQNSGFNTITLLTPDVDISVPVVEKDADDATPYVNNYEIAITQSEKAYMTEDEIEEALIKSLPIPASIKIISNSTDSDFSDYVDLAGTQTETFDVKNSFLRVEADSYNKSIFDDDFNLNAAALSDIEYESSDETVVFVDDTGKVSIVGEGSAIIKVTAVETDLYDSKVIEIPITVAGIESSITACVGDVLSVKPNTSNALTYRSLNTNVASVDKNGNLKAISDGTATIIIKKEASGSNPSISKTLSIVVSKRENNLEVDTSTISKTMTDRSFTIASTANTNISFESSDENVVLVNANGKVTIVGVGSATIRVMAAETSEYKGMKKDIPVVIGKASQTIYGVPVSISKTFGDSEFNIDASARTAISYSSSNNDVVSVSASGTVTIKGAGTATIKIVASETTEYKGATKEFSIVVKKASQNISVASSSVTKSFGDSDFNIGASASTAISYASSNNDVVSVSTDGTVSINGTGAAIITVIAAETDVRLGATCLVAVNVTKANQTISVESEEITKTKADKAFNLNASAKSALTYTSSKPSVVTVSGDGKVTIKGLGTATITITAASSSNYEGASTTVKITVKKPMQTITAKKKTYKVSAKKLSKAAVSYSIGAKAKGKLTYSVTDKASKKVLSVDKNGKVKIKKGAKAGTYTINVKAASTKEFDAATLSVTVVVK